MDAMSTSTVILLVILALIAGLTVYFFRGPKHGSAF